MDLTNNLIELRILLTSLCDGFSLNGKNSILSTKSRILFLLENKDCSPNELINSLCIAKSNIANILKKMIEESLVENYKCENNAKNIFYKITDKGLMELKQYKEKMIMQFREKCKTKEDVLSNNLQTIINILKGKEI